MTSLRAAPHPTMAAALPSQQLASSLTSHAHLASVAATSRATLRAVAQPPLRSSLFATSTSTAFAESSGLLGCRVGSSARRAARRAGPSGRVVVRAAVFDQLSSSLEQAWTKLRAQDKLTRDNIKEPMRDIRRALLEADVSLPVVRRFVREVTERAVGVEVIRGVRPEQQLVKVVNDQLVALMGGNVAEIAYAPEGKGPTVVLMAGLQGVGKTTACGKLALFLKKKGKTSMMVATDVYRPAAIEQLQTLGAQVGVPVYAEGTDARPVDIARQGVAAAKKAGVDVVIVDTAGRLQIDRSMMEELRGIKAAVSPTEVLLVVDAMTGQEAASLVAAFNAEVSITGAILTKVDGDSRGGAALSVKEVSGRPIKFVGEGETMSALEPFYPDRMASRILGMGDVLSLVEKAQELMDKEDEAELRKRIMEAKFDFNDMLKQTRMMARMGSMGGMLKLIPGMNKLTPQQVREAEKSLKVMESMIGSMTNQERADPELLAKSPSRRRRIAKGSGRSQEQVSALISQLFQMRVRMKAVADMVSGKAMPAIPGLDTSGAKKASSGKAKRKKSRTGFSQQLGDNTAVAAGAKGFGGRN
ncbi:unnamed protein product [Closterium sp. NIES-53]